MYEKFSFNTQASVTPDTRTMNPNDNLPPDKNNLLHQLRLDKSASKNASHTTRWWIFGGALLLILGALTWKYLPHPEEPALTPAAAADVLKKSPTTTNAADSNSTTGNVNAAVANPSTAKVLDASGYITARQVATVSAEVMGLILTVEVEEGMTVEKGQVLARLDDTLARINLELAQSQVRTQAAFVQSLKVDYAEAARELKRVENLEHAGNFSSEAQLTRAQTLVQKLAANVASAEAELASANLQVARQQNVLEDHIIRAPFSGVVTTKNAQAGELMSPSSAGGGFTRTGICTIVDMDSLEIQVDVNEAFIGRVNNGQKVVAVLDAYPDLKIPASVIAVIPTADRAKATVRVRIRINEKNPKILPDMGVKVSFLAGGTDHD